jgi:hypothetical protein
MQEIGVLLIIFRSPLKIVTTMMAGIIQQNIDGLMIPFIPVKKKNRENKTTGTTIALTPMAITIGMRTHVTIQ